MATTTRGPEAKKAEAKSAEVIQSAKKEAKPAIQFFTKFNNDWSMNLSAALAYNLLMAIFPIALAALAILGLIVNQDILTHQISKALPSSLATTQIISTSVAQLQKQSGIIGIIAIILALYNGSRLFTLIEGIFGIIYHVRQRTFLRQNLMAFGMLILFIVLIPIMIVAAALPTFAFSFFQNTTHLNFPGSALLFTVSGIIGGVAAAFVFFLSIYIIVPNQKISFRHSWLGSLVAAIALQVYLILFPLFISRALGNLAVLGSAVILLIFFYYFAVILLIGAEVNAFFAEKVKATPVDLVTMVHLTTSHLPKTAQDQQEQAAASHKGGADRGTASKAHLDVGAEGKASTSEQLASLTSAVRQSQEADAQAGHGNAKTTGGFSLPFLRKKQDAIANEADEKVEKSQATTASITPAAGAVVGTALAFVIEWLRMRRERPAKNKKRVVRQVKVRRVKVRRKVSK